MLRLAIAATAATLFCAVLTPAAISETPVERGRYLVETIAGCGNCHTPRGPGGVFAAGKNLAGAFWQPELVLSVVRRTLGVRNYDCAVIAIGPFRVIPR